MKFEMLKIDEEEKSCENELNPFENVNSSWNASWSKRLYRHTIIQKFTSQTSSASKLSVKYSITTGKYSSTRFIHYEIG